MKMKPFGRFATRAVVVATLSLVPAVQAQEGPMTTAEHTAAAEGYRAEAKQAREKAAQHQLMLERYEHPSASQKGLIVPKVTMVSHCRKLVDSYKQAASEASALAKLHADAAAAGHGS